MEITNVRIKLEENSKILAYATITLNDCIVISGIRLYEGNKGKFIVFPTRTSKNNRKFNVVFPCKEDLREKILQEISIAYLDEKVK